MELEDILFHGHAKCLDFITVNLCTYLYLLQLVAQAYFACRQEFLVAPSPDRLEVRERETVPILLFEEIIVWYK